MFSSESKDEALIQSLLVSIQDNEADFTLTFRRLCEAALNPEREGSLRHLFKDPGAYDKWATNWRVRLSREKKAPDERVDLMHQTNPAIIPRNHRIKQAIETAVGQEDYGPFEKLLEVLSSPYDEQRDLGNNAASKTRRTCSIDTLRNLITPYTNVHIFKFRP